MKKSDTADESTEEKRRPCGGTKPPRYTAKHGGLPSVSVIVALYNTEDYLSECLDSILAQTYEGPLEISVHNDASTDASVAVLEVRCGDQ